MGRPGPSRLAIREARRGDAQAIADIHLDARRKAMPWLPVLHSRTETAAYFCNQVLLGEKFLVAMLDGQAVGFIALAENHVEHLYIAPAHQGRGVGGRLLSMAKELHPEGLDLWTFQRNVRARRFYEERGFVTVEFTDGSRNEENEPDVRYRWLQAK